MSTLKKLIDEYDQLGEPSFSAADDYSRRQRGLEAWAAKARRTLEDLDRLSWSPRDRALHADPNARPIEFPKVSANIKY